MDENAVLTLAGELEEELKDAIDATPLAPNPRYDVVNDFLVDTYTEGKD